MATAGDGATPYQSGGAGGKFRKRPIRRSAQATPYDRPPTALRNNSPSLLSKLVNPASRLIYAGADRLFGVFRKRLPSIAAPRPPEIREEPKPITIEDGNLASISATTEISELENMLKQKTFTRSEIEHLTALLQAKTTNSDVEEGHRVKVPSPSSHFLRLEASTSSPLNKHVEERENIHAVISTPVVTSRPFEEDVASPAELARAYMGTRTPKVSPSTLRFGSQAPRQDSALLNTTTILPKTPLTSLTPRNTGTFKNLENGLTTPRSRGRSAIYSMARTPYYRPPSAFTQKVINSPSLPLSYPAREQEGSIESSKMVSKRRSSVLDDIGSGGPVRRIREKANLLSQGSPLNKNRNEFSQKLLLRNEPDWKSSKPLEEKGETSRSNLGYASVPTKSTQMATKILEQLERLSPKEKSPGLKPARTSEKLLLTSSMISGQEKGDSPKLLMSSSDGSKKQESWLVDARESTSQIKGKEKVEENGPRKFAVPRNVLSTMNGNSSVTIRENGPIVTNTDSTFKMPVEPPQKKRFQMTAHEDDVEVDDNNRSNGHVSIPFGEHKKPETSVFANKDVSTEVVQVNKSSLPQVDKIPETQKTDNVKSLPKTDFGSVVNKKVTFNFSASSSSPSSNTQTAVLSQSNSITDTVAPLKKTPVFPTFGASNKNAENVPPFSFSANETSGFKPNTSPDTKPLSSNSMFNSVKENNQVEFPSFKKDDNGSKSESTPTSGIFSFGAKNTTNGVPFSASTTTNNLFSGNSSSTTTTSAASTALPTSAPAPVFSFGSGITPTKSTKDNEQKSDTSFGTPNSLFATSTTNVNGTSGFQASFGGTTAVPSSTSGTSLFGTSPTPSFGINSSVPPTAFSFGASSTSTSPSIFGSSSNATGSSMFSFTATTSSFSSPSQLPSIFGNTTPVFGSSPNNNDQMSMEDSMAEDSTPTPSPGFMFGSSTPTQSAVPFQFGGQTNQPPPLQNPFQPNQSPFMANQTPSQNPFLASGSGEFSAGGSFSLGSGGGDKSGRRILKVKSRNRKK